MPLLTMITDIGEQDFLSGAIKGQFLRYQQDINIIDITHALSAFNYPQAAYVARNAIKNYPTGTFHLILVNIFDEKGNLIKNKKPSFTKIRQTIADANVDDFEELT